MQHAVEAAISACKATAKILADDSLGAAGVLAIAWTIAQGTATALRAEISSTEEGRALIERAARQAAGKLTS